jgi:hypothetical protein
MVAPYVGRALFPTRMKQKTMQSHSLDLVLQRARALCEAAGIDPDQPGADGKPEWFRFLAQARVTLRRDEQSQDPLALLKALDSQDKLPERRETAAPETFDPLERLQALYEAEMGGRAWPSPHQDVREAPAENSHLPGPSGRELTPRREQTDPIAELKALEAAEAARRGNSAPADEEDDPRFGIWEG